MFVRFRNKHVGYLAAIVIPQSSELCMKMTQMILLFIAPQKGKFHEYIIMLQNNYKKKRVTLPHIIVFIVYFSLPHVCVVYFEFWRSDTTMWILVRLKLLSLFIASIFYYMNNCESLCNWNYFWNFHFLWLQSFTMDICIIVRLLTVFKRSSLLE